MRTLARWSEGALEASWLLAVVLTPLFLDKNGAQVFEGAKVGLLRSIAAIALAAWALKAATSSHEDAGSWASRASKLARAPLVLPTLALAGSVALASTLSLAPRESWLGHRGSYGDALTLAAQLAIFAAIAANLRSSVQLRRLVDALILPSIPIVLYAVCERLGYEPLQVTVRETELERVTSFLGQPVFLAAYLAFVVPFTAWRAFEAFRARSHAGLAIYVPLLCLQLVSALFTESRGPLVGLGTAVAVAALALAARRGARRLVIAGWTGATIVCSLIAFMPKPASDSSREVRRASQTFAVHGSGGQFRTTNWAVAARAVQSRAPVSFANGERDTKPWLRPVVGYGPEVLQVVAAPHYDEELTHVFGYFAIERFHNQLWDALLTTGALGLAAMLALQGALLRLLLGKLALGGRWFWLTCTLSALMSAFGWTARYGFGFFFLGLELGLLIGVALYISAQAWSPRAPTAEEGLHVALLAAVTAHLVETSFSFPVIATGLCFWVVAAIALTRRSRAEPTEPDAVPEVLSDAALLSAMTVAMGCAFLGAASLPRSSSAVLHDGLTLLSVPAGARVPVVALMLAVTLVWGALLLRYQRQGVQLRFSLGLASGFTLAFWLWYAAALAQLANARGPLAQLTLRGDATATFYYAAGSLLLLLACGRLPAPLDVRTRWPRVALALAAVPLALFAVSRLGLQPARAEAAAAVGDAYSANNRFDQAEIAYRAAISLAPEHACHRASLAKSFVKQARLEPTKAELALARAELAMREAIITQPVDNENASNLALISSQRAQRASSSRRSELLAEARVHFAHALRMNPFEPALRRGFAHAQLNLFGDPAGALESARRAVALEPQQAAGYALIAEAQLARARSLSGGSRSEALRDAAKNFEQASATGPDQGAYRVGAGRAYLVLGEATKAAEALRVALSTLPAAARERPAALALLQRAEALAH
jgi:tetratricopeptide (TPR) repeat protein